MISERKIRRVQWVTAALAGGLVLVYWFGYRSASLRARELDRPVAETWKQLMTTIQTNAHTRSVQAAVLAEAVQQMEQAGRSLTQAGQTAAARVAWDETIRQRLREEFQLLEFDRQRFLSMAELRNRASAGKVVVADGVWQTYPDYDPNLQPPSLHWALLASARQILETALACQVRAVSNLSVLPTLTYGAGEPAEPTYHHFRLRLELVGEAPALERFLQSLPLRPEDWEGSDLPAVPGKTQAFFVDRVLMKNLSANPDLTGLDVVISAFCPHPGGVSDR